MGKKQVMLPASEVDSSEVKYQYGKVEGLLFLFLLCVGVLFGCRF